MAKRSTPRATTSDPSAPPKPRRTKAASKAADAPSRDGGAPREPSHDEIRQRAYERYLARGANHGQHFDDWVEAEKELRSRK